MNSLLRKVRVIESHLYIVCSDHSRNGKTLFSRLYADCLSLGHSAELRVFDTDRPDGRILHYFPGSSELIDLEDTRGQMRLFDAVLARSGRYVVDLQASFLDRFFSVARDIGFAGAAKESGLGISIFFILDRSMQSISSAGRISGALDHVEFVTVRNEAIGTLLHLPMAAEEYRRIAKRREVVFPKLSQAAVDRVERDDFDFAGFIQGGNPGSAAPEVKRELWNFLETIYDQRVAGASGDSFLI